MRTPGGLPPTHFPLSTMLGLAILLTGAIAQAGGKPGDGHVPRRAQAKTRPAGPYEEPCARAGHPDRVAWWARPTDTPDFRGYYVGGGSPFHGEPRDLPEGTWGWDFVGRWIPRQVALGWWHGRRYSGGTGAYKTDGPKLVGHLRH